jgi:hypothetical protein
LSPRNRELARSLHATSGVSVKTEIP